jgi:NTP pyrophosphatase (non-canonical NTP hydrolase)
VSNFEKYKPKTTEQKLAYLVEECGEVLAAAGKSQRWGLDSYNPELPTEKRESNCCWLMRELQDLKRAISIVEESLHDDIQYFLDSGKDPKL